MNPKSQNFLLTIPYPIFYGQDNRKLLAEALKAEVESFFSSICGFKLIRVARGLPAMVIFLNARFRPESAQYRFGLPVFEIWRRNRPESVSFLHIAVLS